MDLLITREPVRAPMNERSGLHGTVVVRVCMSKRGRVISAAIIEGNPMAYGAVLDSIHHWTFNPYRV
jgi:outer membrane biosynthesis protein TonB